MPLSKMEIEGYRGFLNKGTVEFAIPDNQNDGSGLTIITGPNNSGKSSILECLRARSGHQTVSFSSGSRNSRKEAVEIAYTINDQVERIVSTQKGSSETRKENSQQISVFVLPSRRSFNPYFHRTTLDRESFLNNSPLPAQRSSTLSNFEGRLFRAAADPRRFNEVLSQVLDDNPEWSIDLSDQGQYFLKFIRGEQSHSSDGIGEGIVSIFAIIDALYDSTAGSVIVIDEPELSLHPALQKRLAKTLYKYSRDRQVIISTHSPYFVDLRLLQVGAKIIKVKTGEEGTKIHSMSKQAIDALSPLLNNMRNPHIFGLDAREMFFQEDGIILTEGQDDVLYVPIVAKQAGFDLPGSIYGWGAGGADNIRALCITFNSLGFQKVSCILDNDKELLADSLRTDFPHYQFNCIPAKDIRTKPEVKSKPEVPGLLDTDYNVKPELLENTKSLLESIAKYLNNC